MAQDLGTACGHSRNACFGPFRARAFWLFTSSTQSVALGFLVAAPAGRRSEERDFKILATTSKVYFRTDVLLSNSRSRTIEIPASERL